MRSDPSLTPAWPEWLNQLAQVYDPTRPMYRAGVVRLTGAVRDIFYYDSRSPEVGLVDLLVLHYGGCADTIVSWNPGKGLIYHQGSPPVGVSRIESEEAPPPSGASAWDPQLLLQRQRAERPSAPARGAAAGGAHPTDPFSAIREVDNLFRLSGRRHVIAVFLGLHIWELVTSNDPEVLSVVDGWPIDLLRRGHLAIFAAPRFSPTTADFLGAIGTEPIECRATPSREAVRRRLLLEPFKSNSAPVRDPALLGRVIDMLTVLFSERSYTDFVQYLTVNRDKKVYDEAWLQEAKQSLRKQGATPRDQFFKDLVLHEADLAKARDIVASLRDPEGYRNESAARIDRSPDEIKLPRKFLLQGPPGTGKTSLAAAIANETELPFFAVKPSDATSKWRGEPVELVKQAFARWRAAAPCIAFLDEVDSIARSRGDSHHSDDPITQLLTETDPATGWDERIVLICATNRPDDVDSAFRQRFESWTIGLPDQASREALVRMFFKPEKRVVFEPGLDVATLARLFEDQAPRSIAKCSEQMDNQLKTLPPSSQITRGMIQQWLARNRLDANEVAYWKRRAEEEGGE